MEWSGGTYPAAAAWHQEGSERPAVAVPKASPYKRGDWPEPRPSSPAHRLCQLAVPDRNASPSPGGADGWASLAQGPPSPSLPARV
ncbi:unnamed protein product [Rangifer tarandus platyrhynchus]|uniref:Uncharacterized protein n=1 Tax=Rangifer tarandus platyrhynchus TaxID=3082113 RepID=A0ABN8ZU31_RANTA|nr:unnamed protein product [Rangifer tarandus platyrhynchus]